MLRGVRLCIPIVAPCVSRTHVLVIMCEIHISVNVVELHCMSVHVSACHCVMCVRAFPCVVLCWHCMQCVC